MNKQQAWDELEKMAREINPNLPSDLRGYEITISLSIHGRYAMARKVERMRWEAHGKQS